jgi:hypothetical protein
MSSRQEKATAEVLEPASQAENIVNGVNVTALFQTVEAVKVNPGDREVSLQREK